MALDELNVDNKYIFFLADCVIPPNNEFILIEFVNVPNVLDIVIISLLPPSV